MGRKMMSYEVGEQVAFVVRTTSYYPPKFVPPTVASEQLSGPWLVFEEPVFEEMTPHERHFEITVDGVERGEDFRRSHVGSFVLRDIMRHVFEVIN